MKPLRIYAPVWGNRHIDQFERAILKSFAWPKNAEALEGNIRCWHIYTRAENKAKLSHLMERIGQPFDIRVLDAFKDTTGQTAALCNAGLEVMQACVDDGSLFFTGETDFVFADGSIETMLSIAQRPRVTVTVPHMRVLPHFLELLDHPVGCAEMVKLAMTCPHRTWLDAEIGVKGFFREHSNQYYGGLSWERSDKMYLVQHVIPNAWISNIEPSDLDLMRKYNDWSAWDHRLPSKFIKEGRNRVIGSSDAAFMVEITSDQERNSPNSQINTAKPDAFYRDDWADGEHHNAYRMCISVFREP